ncbi:hypothetical protein [Halobacteriovorax sp. JY17]|uniref:hypothetical protein n=1 Tax=Halobacteriovorax sp. JY17 TaxID=2014617 RepID=UPI0025C04AD7|nr:hypothetical protein [Halobacteriovorax sp. JY17]
MNHIKTLDNVSISQGICEYWDIRIEETIKTEIIYQDYELTVILGRQWKELKTFDQDYA